MAQPTLSVVDAGSVTRTVNTINPNGQATAANSQPVVLSSDQASSIQQGSQYGLLTAAGPVNFVFSTNNSFSGTVTFGTPFVGTTESILSAPGAAVLLRSDQSGTLTLTEYIDAGGTQISAQTPIAIVAGVPYQAYVAIAGNYFKVQFANLNNATPANVRLDTQYGSMPTTGQQPAVHSSPVVLASDTPLPPGTNSIGKVNPTNFTATFRDGFDVYPSANWTTVTGSGDVVRLDGNATGASYLVISKDPLTPGTTTSLTSSLLAGMPIELSVGVHMSQRTLGQDVSVEVVSAETPLAAYTDVAISSVSQATTTLTVTTAANHGLAVGNAIALYGVNDSRFNYPSLVVATIPTPTSFTVTAGPGGTIPSVTAGPFTTGFVTLRPRLGLAPSGTSMIFENATATNASVYVRANAGDALMSGTPAGNHSVTVGTTASIQAVNSPYTYAFRPTTEFRLALMTDRTQWFDASVDSSTQASNRQTWTQVIPDNTKSYNLRIRAVNNKGLTVPVAKIVSMAKTGTTTATVVTNVAHGLTVADLVNIYGSSDQTNYANLTAATAVASVIDSTTFTVVIGNAVTSTVYGGYVARVNGGNLMSSVGAVAQAAVNAVLATAADGTQALTLTGSASWAGLSIGDYVNVHGLRSVPGVGSDLGCDGAWMVRNVATTTLELGPIGTTTPPANFGSTVTGGAVIKRTDIRLSFARVFDFDRTRVELLARPSGDTAAAAPVNVQNASIAVTTNNASVNIGQVGGTATVNGGVAGIISVGGNIAHSSARTANPITVGGQVTPTLDTTLAQGDVSYLMLTTAGQLIQKPFGDASNDWTATSSTTPLATTTSTAAKAAAAAGLRNYVTGCQFFNTSATVSTTITILDGATVLWAGYLPAITAALPLQEVKEVFQTPLKGTAATALNIQLGTTAASVYWNLQGYVAP